MVYYYTYASLLAGMYLPRDPVRSTLLHGSDRDDPQIRASSFGSDETIASILDESESICRNMLSTPAAPRSAHRTATGDPGPHPRTPASRPTKTPSPANP